MKKILAILTILLGMVAPARADYVVKDANGNIITIKSGIIGSAVLPWMSPVDATGTAFGTVGNPFALQFGTGVLLPAFAATPTFNCGTGCSGSNASVGATGAAIPGSANYIGMNVGGNLTGLVGTANGLKVDGSAVTQPISAAALPLPAGAATSALQSSTITAIGTPFQAGGSIGNTSFGIAGTLPAFAATPTVNIGTLGQALAAGSVPVVLTAAQITTLTPPATVAVTQGTAANLNATVVGTGTFAVQANQSGTWNIGTITTIPALVAGAAIIGKVGIDQTTPGTTNAVQATNFPSSVATGTGAQGATVPRVTVATDTATVAGSASIPAGTNLMGKVGVDQTTPGTTNGVSLAQVGTNTVSTGAGATGTGTQRVGVAQDTTTVAGSAPGTAGTPSTNVVSVQGEAAMTPILDTPQATENHIGEVGGNLIPITNAMTTTSATTLTGQSIGGLQTLASAVRVSAALGASGTSGYIQDVSVSFTDAVATGPLEVWYFNANPTGSTCTNDSAFVLANADRDKVIGVADITNFKAGNTAVFAQAHNLAMGYGVASATSIFSCVVARSSFAIAGTTNASLITKVVRN
jgi:hypothetical protein